MKDKLSFYLISRLGVFFCAVQLMLRVCFFVKSANGVSWSMLDILRTLSLGVFYDIAVVLCLIFPIFFVSLILKNSRRSKSVVILGVGIFFTFLIFTTICEYLFWEEFHTRFNFIAVDYLVYTHEIIRNIIQSYPVYPLLMVTMLSGAGLTWMLMNKYEWEYTCSTWMERSKSLIVYFCITGFGLFFMNSSYAVYVSGNRYNQEIALNGIFQLFHAFFYNELDYKRFYFSIDDDFVINHLQKKLSLDNSVLKDKESSARIINNTGNNYSKKPNIVVIVVESLSAAYTGLVNKEMSLTPYLDELSEESFTYDRVYATGTRTVRGLEAIAMSLPPTPGQSIVRRPDCGNSFTIGTPLQKSGYKTQFVYGGYGYFDNMNDFFSSNGYDIVDRSDIPKEEINFETVWGVADEILFKQALKQMDMISPNQPLMQVVLTTTNHRPYAFPQGSIEAEQGKRESVVKYTDWAIHNFLQQAKTREWFDNTVFVILADHNASVAGKTSLPVGQYHIPCLVYAPKIIRPGHNNRLMSQIDVLPTVFGMLGISYESKNLGYDINKLPLGQERAFISTYQQLGFIKDDKLIILEPNCKVAAYGIEDYEKSTYSEIEVPRQLVEEAVTWYQGASCLYREKKLKL